MPSNAPSIAVAIAPNVTTTAIVSSVRSRSVSENASTYRSSESGIGTATNSVVAPWYARALAADLPGVGQPDERGGRSSAAVDALVPCQIPSTRSKAPKVTAPVTKLR